MDNFGPPERVYVENDWYDGPIAGVADVQGVPHRFKAKFDETNDEYGGTYFVWPIDRHALELEEEQWQIFVAWNDMYEAGKAGTDLHPGHGGLDERWDEIQVMLQADRELVPTGARQAKLKLERINGDKRYDVSGPDYRLRWRLL